MLNGLRELSRKPSREKHSPFAQKAVLSVVTLYMGLVNRHLHQAPLVKLFLGVYSRQELQRHGPQATFNKLADKTYTPDASSDTLHSYASMVAGLVSMAIRVARREGEDAARVELLESLLKPTWITDKARSAALALYNTLMALEPPEGQSSGTRRLEGPSFPPCFPSI